MTEISGVSPPTLTGSLGPDPSRTQPNQTDFLKLLTTQLTNQDPLDPSDSTQFIEQLATFSSLEQLENIKGSLDALAITQTSVVSATAVEFAGKVATVQGSSFDLPSEGEVDLGAYLPDGGRLTATVKDQTGRVVRTFELGVKEPGITHFEWDGLDDDGNKAAASRYNLEVSAADGDDVRPAMPLVRGVVDAVSFERGYAELLISGRRYQLGSILEIGSKEQGEEHESI